MMVSMETYLRRGKRSLKMLALSPGFRTGGAVLAYWGSGFLLSAASLLDSPQPLALGLICAASGWRSVLIGLGAALGYPCFWGQAGGQGIVWSAAAVMLSLMVGRGEHRRDAPLLLPFTAALLTAVTGLTFRLLNLERAPLSVYGLRVALSLGGTMLFMQAFSCRDAVTDWLVGGVAVLALAQAAPWPWLNPGYILAGMLAVGGALPAAALAGAGLDLARVAAVPMTAVLSLAFFLRLIPFRQRWQQYGGPALCCLGVSLLWGVADYTPLPGLLLGGCLAALLPPRAQILQRRGGTGLAQVRLELGAEVLAATGQLLLEMEPPPIDVQGLLDRACQRACSACSARRSCTQKDQLRAELLEHPLDADCRKPGRLIPELNRAREQLKDLQGLRRKQGEYRGALLQQYRFLGDFLRGLADKLPRRGEEAAALYQVQVSARSRGKERANGDRCLAFPGPGPTYFILLCDGMGTGMGAAQEGGVAAEHLRRMLLAGFPAKYALRSYNSLLALRDAAGAVTMDLAELHLDSGLVRLYKWGAAPSWVLTRRGTQKIGTATPPPGIAVTGIREAEEKLSLRRGEVLILLSDGVDGEGALSRTSLSPDAPPGELAAEILERGCGSGEDDATVAVVRLRPANLSPS